MAAASNKSDRALRAFLRRVWKHDVAPLLRDKRAEQRRRSARTGGKLAASAGLLVDSVFRLRGRPFTRFMTVMGASLGAMLPDVWDWKWLRESASDAERDAVADQVRRRVEQLPEADALALFDLPPTATREQLQGAWRTVARRWHPDKAPDDAARREYHLRFVTFGTAYERLEQAYDAGRLPHRPPRRAK